MARRADGILVVPRLGFFCARATILTALLLGARAAGAQTITGFALDRYAPAGAGSSWSTLESLDFDGHLRPAFAADADWAWKPLVFYDPGGHELGALVRQQAVLTADAAVMLWRRARVDLALPLPLVDSGSDVLIRTQNYGGPRGWSVGDLRLGGDVRLLGGPHDPWRLALGARLYVPTGGTRSFTGDGGFRFWPRVMGAGQRGRFDWAASAGVHVRPSCGCNLAPGTELTWGAGAAWAVVPRVRVGAELSGSAAFSSASAFSRAAPPLELLLAGHVAVAPRWRVSGGFGPGLTDGPGSPVVRAVLGVQYDMTPPPSPPPTPLPATPPAWSTEPAAGP
jgi:hypothetical protein